MKRSTDSEETTTHKRLGRAGGFDDTLLHLIAFAGQVNDVEALLRLGANIDVRGDIGNSPLHFAVPGYQADVVRLLSKSGANGM